MRYIIAMLDNVYQEVNEYTLESKEKARALKKITEAQNLIENLNAEASGYADGDEEYEENIKKAKVGFYEIEEVLLKK